MSRKLSKMANDWFLKQPLVAEEELAKLRKQRAELVEEIESLKIELKEKNYAAGVALDLIWNQFFRTKYGDWDYPAQVARYCLEDLTLIKEIEK